MRPLRRVAIEVDGHARIDRKIGEEGVVQTQETGRAQPEKERKLTGLVNGQMR